MSDSADKSANERCHCEECRSPYRGKHPCGHVTFQPGCGSCLQAEGYDGEDLEAVADAVIMRAEIQRITRRCPKCGKRHRVIGIEDECLQATARHPGRYEQKLEAQANRLADRLDDIKSARLDD